MTAMTHEPITLLNADFQILSANLSMQKAARLLSLVDENGIAKAVVQESIPDRFLGPYPFPRVLRLTYWVKIAYNRIYGPPRVSKRGVLIRDNHTCAFCGKPGDTVDHVKPKSKGGLNTWQNLVTACTKCNHKKGARTPEEANMTLLWKGYVPSKAKLFTPRS